MISNVNICHHHACPKKKAKSLQWKSALWFNQPLPTRRVEKRKVCVWKDGVLQTECSRLIPIPLTSLPGRRSCSPALSVTDGEPDQRGARGGGYANVARWCERDALSEQSSTYAWMRYKDNEDTELCFFVNKTIATWLQSVPSVTRQCILVSNLISWLLSNVIFWCTWLAEIY